MQVSVKLIGQLLDLVPPGGPLGARPRGATRLEVDDGFDLAALLLYLKLPPDLEYFAMVNEDHVPAVELPTHVLNDGDVVVLVPPMKGG